MPRVHFAIRYGTFAASTLSLSLFFAGWRTINTTGGAGGFVLLAAGVLLTALLLTLQGYWIYFEEKNKGTLRRANRFFEALHAAIDSRFASNRYVRLIQPQLVTGEEGSKQ